MVICLERGADLHTAQLMPLPLTVSCFSKFQIVFTFLVPAHLGSPGQRAVKRACVRACVCVCVCVESPMSDGTEAGVSLSGAADSGVAVCGTSCAVASAVITVCRVVESVLCW